jgi:hypothetical protein
MSTLIKLVQPLNAPSSIVLTPPPRLSVPLRFVSSRNALLEISVTIYPVSPS